MFRVSEYQSSYSALWTLWVDAHIFSLSPASSPSISTSTKQPWDVEVTGNHWPSSIAKGRWSQCPHTKTPWDWRPRGASNSNPRVSQLSTAEAAVDGCWWLLAAGWHHDLPSFCEVCDPNGIAQDCEHGQILKATRVEQLNLSLRRRLYSSQSFQFINCWCTTFRTTTQDMPKHFMKGRNDPGFKPPHKYARQWGSSSHLICWLEKLHLMPSTDAAKGPGTRVWAVHGSCASAADTSAGYSPTNYRRWSWIQRGRRSSATPTPQEVPFRQGSTGSKPIPRDSMCAFSIKMMLSDHM